MEDLLTALWGDDAPNNSRRTVQVYIRRLRTALGGQRILREPAGYRIIVNQEELDSARFTKLVAAAHHAEPERASALLRDALDLWISNAFEGVRDHSPIAEEARRLDEERIRVQSWHARLQLKLGRHAELVPHLSKLIDEHPYREDLRAHLMLALYRSGRQSDALEVYRDTRRLLDDELGIEPGPDLQRLHESILRADPSLRLPKRPTTTVPRGLPADITSFVGRREHLHALNDMLGDSSPIVISAISGSAGVGKTALAVHWAHAVADRFPDGQLYINLRGFDPAGPPVDPVEAVRHFLDALGVAPQRIPASPEAQGTLYRSLISDRRMLLVLDNARDAQQVRPLLPGSPGCLTLITSRNQQASLVATHNARPLLLDVLTEPEALDFLAARLGAARVVAEPSAAAAIIARCARLPLALAIAAAQATIRPHLPLAELATELQDIGSFRSDDPLTDLHAVFSWSYERLSPAAARLFRLLALHPGPDLNTAAATSLAGIPTAQARQLLSELLEAHLLAGHLPDRYAFHDLLRDYAARQSATHDEAQERRAAVERLLDHYVHTARAASIRLTPTKTPIDVAPQRPDIRPESFSDLEEARAWFAAQRGILSAVVQLASTDGTDTHVWQLATSLVVFFDWQGHWHDLIAAQTAALNAANRLDDARKQASAHRALARAHHCLGDNSTAHAHLIEALRLFEETNDPIGQANTHMGLGMLEANAGDFRQDLKHQQRAFKLFELAGPSTAAARVLNAIGWCYAHLGELDKAADYCNEALSRLLNTDDQVGIASTWDTLGVIHHKRGNNQEALNSYHTSLQLFRGLGDLLNQATILTHIGAAYQALGDSKSAGRSWQEAHTILSDLHHPDEAIVRVKIEELRQSKDCPAGSSPSSN